MPGIFGIIGEPPQPQAEALIEQMTDAMRYEPFYRTGSLAVPELGAWLGWCCHEGAFCDCLPVVNEKKNIRLLFHGENHFDKEQIAALKGRNHQFNQWNASYLVHLYEEEGEGFLRRLNGLFSGVVLDLEQKKLLLFNDRYGVERVYWARRGRTFYFASEAKAILKVLPEARAFCEQGLAEHLYCQCVFDNRTLFKNVYLLPGGSVAEFREGRQVATRRYFDPADYRNQPYLEDSSFYEKLRGTFRRVLPRYVRSKSPIAFSLTGGLDTRAILANLDVPSERAWSYTLAGMHRECYDARIGRRIAAQLGLQHAVYRLDERFLKEFPSWSEKAVAVSDGYFDMEGAPSLYLHAQVRQRGGIRITGNYGGQVLKGICNLKAGKLLPQVFDPGLSARFAAAAEKLKEATADDALSVFLFKQLPWYHFGRFACERSQIVERAPFLDNDLVQVLYQARPGLLSDRNITCRLIADGDPALAAIPTDRGVVAGRRTPADLARRLWREGVIKLEYYYDYGMPQWAAPLDATLARLNPGALLRERSKYYGFRLLYRDGLAGYLREVLLDPRTLQRAVFDGRQVQKVVDAHIAGRGNHTLTIRALVALELAHRVLLDG